MNSVGVGRIERTIGSHLLARLPAARIGDGVRIEAGKRILAGTVAAIARDGVVIAAMGSIQGVATGDRVLRDDAVLQQVFGFGALGRAVDGCGAPLDGGDPLRGRTSDGSRAPVPPATRGTIQSPLWTGIRAIDGLLTVGRGARIGIFGAPGTGKSTLLETIARWAEADAVVVALVGERGREAAQWLKRRTMKTTIVCATSDRTASERVRAAQTALAQAATLRDRGLNVLVIFDSLARYAQALRESMTASGEPVGRGGYPAAVFTELARLLESAGPSAAGSVSMIASVLSEGADERDPVSEAARSLLDGHIRLSLDRAGAGLFPAIDILASASRTMDAVVDPDQRDRAHVVRAAIGRLAQSRDARELGLLRNADPLLTRAIDAQAAIESFLVQREPCAPADTLRQLRTLVSVLTGPI